MRTLEGHDFVSGLFGWEMRAPGVQQVGCFDVYIVGFVVLEAVLHDNHDVCQKQSVYGCFFRDAADKLHISRENYHDREKETTSCTIRQAIYRKTSYLQKDKLFTERQAIYR
jgi:hypothetical protein